MQTTLGAPSTSERIAVVDVLRAFALLGIIVTHSVTGFLAGQPPVENFMQFSALDRVVAQAEHLLTFGKFYTIFSFLFGLSFAIQLRNAADKGAPFKGRFAWRLAVLGLIALAHSAFFTGDVLIIYALLGLLLIPFRNLKTRTLLIVAVILVLNVPGLLLGVAQVAAPPPTPEQLQNGAEMQASFLAAAQHAYEVKQSGSVGELAQVAFTHGMLSKLAFLIFSGRLWITFGLFLLGLCAGRLEIFKDTDANRRFFRKLIWPAGLIALVTTVAEWVRPAGFMPQSLLDLASSFSFTLQQLSLSAFYVALVTLLFWREPSRGVLPALAPAGRMGLTTYLTQTAFGVLVFYGLGLGLLGTIGAAAAVGAGLAFFVLQIFLARAWAMRYRMGPVEWLWRSLTHLKWQPNRVQTTTRTVADAA